MTEINDGGPAFPHTGETNGITTTEQDGMSRRDWLAGLAMQGLLSSGDRRGTWAILSAMSYKVADTMIAEGNAHV